MEQSFFENKRNRTTFLICILLGFIFHYLFYGKSLGVSVPIYLILFYTLFYWRLYERPIKHSLFEWFLIGNIGLLAFTFIIFTDALFMFLNILMIIGLIFFHTIVSKIKEIPKWYTVKFIGISFELIGETIRNFFLVFRFGGNQLKTKMKKSSYDVLKRVGIGLLISIPLLWVVIGLLASADKGFGQLIMKIPNWMIGFNLGSLFWQVGLIIVVAFGLFAYVMTLSNGYDDNNEASLKKETAKMFMDSIIIVTVLLMINAVFILYMYVQFAYFFTGDPSSTALDYTYSEYARRGFFELTLVTIINFVLILGTIHFRKGSSKLLEVVIKIFLTLLVIFSVVMLLSGFYRLSLYEQAYGYTHLRILVHTFMIFLLTLITIAFIRIWSEKVRLAKWFFVVGLMFYSGLNYANINELIANKNIERFENTGKIDVYYLGALSFEAIPVLVELERNQTLPELSSILDEKFSGMKNDNKKWQEYNWSKSKAYISLRAWSQER